MELAYRICGRWKQENWFKYMREHFALHTLSDYAIKPDDPQRLVINPEWRELNKQIETALARLREAEAAYGCAKLSKASADDLDAMPWRRPGSNTNGFAASGTIRRSGFHWAR